MSDADGIMQLRPMKGSALAPTTYAQRAVYFRRAAETARSEGDARRAVDLEEFARRCDRHITTTKSGPK